MKNQLWLRLFAVALGGVYLVSGIGKAMDINAFTDIVVQYSHEKMKILAPLIVGTEITLGFAFLFGVFLRQFASVSICILVFFTIFIAIGYGSGKLEDCGCFGVLLKIDPAWALARNVVMLGLSFSLFKYAHQWQNWLFSLSLTFGLIAFGVTGYEMKNTYRALQVHTGSDLRNTFLGQYTQSSDTQLFFIFSPTCPHCLNATDNVKKYRNKGIEVISIFPNTSTKQSIDNFRSQKIPNFEMIATEPDSMRKLIRTVPTAFLVEKGIIQKIYTTYIPAP